MLVVVFGQELPDATSNVFEQTFSIVVASVGLGTFALVLALVEQVVLEVSIHPSAPARCRPGWPAGLGALHAECEQPPSSKQT